MTRSSLKRNGQRRKKQQRKGKAQGQNGAVGKKQERRQKTKQEKLEFVQDFIPVKNIANGIIETTDGRYIKILEIEPINFMLRSGEEQFNIISSFASWLKISPVRMQFKSITRKADSDKHISMVQEDLAAEESEACRKLARGYLRLIKDVGSREALTRRFFLIFQYEEMRRGDANDYSQVYGMLNAAEQNAKAYFLQCGNSIIKNKDEDEAAAEMLYMFFNRRSCVDEPFQSRVNRVVLDTMAAKNKVIGVDPVPKIRISHFLAPRGIDLSHHNYIIMDGLYYSFLFIKGNGYPGRVRGGWMSSLINAGDGIDIDVFLTRENRSRAIDKVAQRIRLNRTKLKDMQDTSTDYEELTSSIQAGYYIKHGIASNTVYNTRASAMKWSGMGEFKALHCLMEIGRMNAGVLEVDSTVLFGESYEAAVKTLLASEESKRLEFRFDGIYRHIYFIAMNELGIRQMRLLMLPDWKRNMQEVLFDEENLAFDRGIFEYDAFVDGVYVFSHLDSDLARLIRFKEAVTGGDGRYEVVCYPHQLGFLREYLGDRVGYKTIGMELLEAALGKERW